MDPPDNVTGSITVLDDASERLSRLLQIWRLGVQPAQSGSGADDCRCDRLLDLMGNRSRQLPHRRDAVRVRQLRLNLAVPTLAFACCLLGALALGQIDHEGYALLQPSFEDRLADQHRHAAAVFLQVLLLIGLRDSGRLQLRQAPLVGIAPLSGSQFPPTQATRDEIVAAVSHDPEKGFIRVNEPTVRTPDEDADGLGDDQPSYSRLP